MSNEYESNTQPVDAVRKDETITGQYVVIKQDTRSRLKRVFFPADVTNVKDFLIWDIILPNFKLFLHKSINDIFGGPGYRPLSYDSRPTYSSRSWLDNNVSYAQPGDTLPESFNNDRRSRQSSSVTELEHLGYFDEERARKARNELYFKAKHNNVATLSDFCRVSNFWNPAERKEVKVEPKWTYNDFGWTLGDIERSNIVFNGSIYLIDLPPARDITALRK